MERVRVGIVGIGNIAQLNVRGYLEHPDCDVVALCDPREDKARAMAELWGVPDVHTSLDDLLARPDVDAVEVCTPTHLHKEHVLAALAAGKHVSVQKPIANTVSDAVEMAEAARAAGLVLRVTDNSLHHPPMVKARELIRAGAIGTPKTIRLKTLVGTTDSEFQAGLEYEGYLWRTNEHSPGGHLFDDVVHKYALAGWLVDTPIRSVQAIVRKGSGFFEEPTVILLEYAREDLLGTMEVVHAPDMLLRSKYYGADEFVEIQGTEGLIWVTRHTGEMWDLPSVVLHKGDEVTSFPLVDGDWGTGFTDAGRHMVDALLAGEPTATMTADEAADVLRLCFAVYQASAERRVVDLDEITGSFSPPWWPLWRTDASQ